jgi:hypothetical protein
VNARDLGCKLTRTNQHLLHFADAHSEEARVMDASDTNGDIDGLHVDRSIAEHELDIAERKAPSELCDHGNHHRRTEIERSRYAQHTARFIRACGELIESIRSLIQNDEAPALQSKTGIRRHDLASGSQ